jgi:hypothetical protein
MPAADRERPSSAEALLAEVKANPAQLPILRKRTRKTLALPPMVVIWDSSSLATWSSHFDAAFVMKAGDISDLWQLNMSHHQDGRAKTPRPRLKSCAPRLRPAVPQSAEKYAEVADTLRTWCLSSRTALSLWRISWV